MVVVNVFLTCNLQLIYHQKAQDITWPGFVPLRDGFNDCSGLNIFAMSPTMAYSSPNQQPQAASVRGIVLHLADIFEKIKNIEECFNSANERAAALVRSMESRETRPLCLFSCKPGVLDRDDPAAIVHEQGQSSPITAEDKRRQGGAL